MPKYSDHSSFELTSRKGTPPHRSTTPPVLPWGIASAASPPRAHFMSESPSRKDLGSYYTPPEVVRTLVAWAREQDPGGPVLDPSCGDGRFLAGWTDAVGVDIDPAAAAEASRRTHAEIITADFFAWATSTDRRFTAVVGNPPFIRYQRFSGRARRRALEFCAAQRGQAVRAVLVLGTVRRWGFPPPEAGGALGVRGSCGDRTCGVRQRCRPVSSAVVRTRRSRCGSREAIPGSLGRLLATACVRIRRTVRSDSFHSTRFAWGR